MATIFTGAVNSNWNNAGNWSGGSIPTSTDDVQFNSSSPSCTIDYGTGNNECLKLDFTGYTSTITFNYDLTSRGDVTLSSSGMFFSGSATLRVGAGGTQTLTSNGTTLGVTLALAGSGSSTIDLADNWTVDSLYIASGVTFIIDGGGNTITVLTSFTSPAGNYIIEGNGTGSSSITIVLGGPTSSAVTWDGTIIGTNATLDIDTSGTVTINNVECDGGTIKYTSGSVSCGTGTLTVIKGTLDTGGMGTTTNPWYDVTSANSSQTVTLDSDLYVGNNFTVGGSTGTVIFNQDTTETIYVAGDLIVGSGGGIKGTATIVLVTTTSPNAWTGQWSAAGPGGIVQNNMIVYSCNSRAFISGTQVYYEEGLLTMYA